MKKLFIFFILILALFLRVYNLTNVPVGFHGDEASIGYNAYSLLKTARDQNNNLLPLSIDQFGDFRPAGYHYAAIPFIALFGLNEFATRLPSALFGSFTVVVVFFLAKELFKNESIAYLASFFLAISPWHINTSRVTSEGIIAIFFILVGFLLYLKYAASVKKSSLLLFFTFLSLSISFLFYHAARFFVIPAFISMSILMNYIYKLSTSKKREILMLNLILIICFFLILLISRGFSRPFEISVFNEPTTKIILKNQIFEDESQNALLTRILHNKLVSYSMTFFDNYFKHFSGEFLFIKGGLPLRYRIPWTGNMYLLDGLFLVFGFSFMLTQVLRDKKYIALFPILWLLLGPIPAALTFEDIPNVQRSIMMLPALVIISAYGFYTVVKLIKKRTFLKIFICMYTIIFVYTFFSFLHNYFRHSFTHEPWYRNVGENELVTTIKQLKPRYKRVVMTSQNDNNIIYYLFYWKIDPKYYQGLGSPRDKDKLQFENMTFTYAHCPLEGNINTPADGIKGVLYINLGECKTAHNMHELKVIYRTDGTPAFRAVEL